ncbi:MAG TPA: UDP-N-acetylmuramoyl-L-alanyl-D-glutamate--2,6-diaminopimelate ligase, partial [Candidatus Methylomirabilis sp.]
MDLLELLEKVDVLEVHGTRAREIEGICFDSRRCETDFLFVAVAGLKSDGHLFVPEAVRRGAKAIVYEKEIARHASYTSIRVRDSRRALGVLGKNFFENPSGALGLIGVTGTNGKTTVTYLLESILREAGHEPGVIGTVNYRWSTKVLPASHTTPESFELQRLLAEIRSAGITHVVMEVSSHALELRRVEDCEFDLGIFMNLSQDHLDFHGTMEDYYASKKRFFTDLLAGEKNGRRQGRIINIDDAWGRRLAEELGAKGLTTFGIDSIAFVQAKEAELSLGEIRAEIETPAGAFPLRAPLSGRFNLYNILAATAAAFHLGIPLSAIQRGIEIVKPVPGRLEKISETGEPAVFVDYAHSEDALKRVLQNLARFRKGRIITVFGCGGDRDRGKRPLMGRAAAEQSDLVIVTSDNPRTEEPLAIIGAIEGGIDANVMKKISPEELRAAGAGKTYTVVADRREA